ncbi:MAG: sodium/solute symporter [Alphaproteobacteria bacterium]|nr:sodium/solute symporter [Alphaproteobacteria bacterium]
MHPVDLTLVVLYLVATLLLGAWVSRGVQEDEDLFLAGRSLSWGPIGLSLFASNISSTTLVGLAGAAYVSGIAVSAYEWMAGAVLVLMSFVVVPVYLKARISTVPEYLERRFDRRLRLYFSAITIFLSIVVDTAGGLYAGSLVLQVFWPDLPVTVSCFGMALIAGLYTTAGGLRAVVYTDVVQAIVLLVGSFALTAVAFGDLGNSWAAVIADLPPERLSLVRPLDDPDLPWLGLVTGVPVLGFWYWATNQYITQRILAAKDVTQARWGAMLGGGLKLLPLFVMVLPGTMAIHLLPGLDDPDMVLPTMIRQLLPVGVTGLMIAALVSAILSSVDSTLNAASALVVHDFLGGDDQAGARTGRISTLVLMTIAAVWAPFIAEAGGLFAYLQQAFAIVAPPVAVVFLAGIVSPRVSREAGLLGMFGGHLLGLGFFVAGQLGVWPVHFTITAGLTTLLTAALVALGSVVWTARPVPPDAVFHAAQLAPARPMPWWKDYRWQAVAVLGCIGATVVGFW